MNIKTGCLDIGTNHLTISLAAAEQHIGYGPDSNCGSNTDASGHLVSMENFLTVHINIRCF